MSEGGLCFYCEEELSVKDRLLVNITIPEFNSAVSAFGRVVWTQRSTQHVGSYLAGVEFVGLEESEKDVIRRLAKATQSK